MSVSASLLRTVSASSPALLRLGGFEALTVVSVRHRSSLVDAVDEASKTQSVLPGAALRDAAGLFHDFKYKYTPAAQSKQEVQPRFQEAYASEAVSEDQRPLVFVFGWAGATEKNLDKYAQIYQKAGCSTMAYILPTRFIFGTTEDVPFIAEKLLKVIELEGMANRPIFFHNLSDTGTERKETTHSI